MVKETRYKKLRGQDVPIDRDMDADEIKEYKKNLPKWLQNVINKKV